jgi:hypothetical protein
LSYQIIDSDKQLRGFVFADVKTMVSHNAAQATLTVSNTSLMLENIHNTRLIWLNQLRFVSQQSNEKLKSSANNGEYDNRKWLELVSHLIY